jgi:hypothetical protein
MLDDQRGVIGRQLARHMLRLEHVYVEAIRAWERSKIDTTRRRQRRTRGGANGDATVAELVVENTHGDPRYLEEARKALADARKLCGLDAPQQFEVHATPNPYPYAHLSDDELRAKAVKTAWRILAQFEPIPSTTPLMPEDPSDDPVEQR